MSALAALQAAAAASMDVAADGDDLVLRSPRQPAPEILDLLRRHKAEILRLHRDHAGWSEEDWQVLFDERAAIMEFDGGLSRAEAEAGARQEVETLRRLVAKKP